MASVEFTGSGKLPYTRGLLQSFFQLIEYLENYLSISEILGSIQRTDFGQLICLCVYAQKFYDTNLWPLLGATHKVLLNSLNNLENYLAISEILASIQRTGFGKIICLCDYAQKKFDTKLWPSEKSKFRFFELQNFFSFFDNYSPK